MDNGTYTGNVFREGKGEQQFNDGSVFKGLWRRDEPWWGEMTFPVKGRFKGAFKNFLPYYGRMYDLDKSVKTPLYYYYFGKKTLEMPGGFNSDARAWAWDGKDILKRMQESGWWDENYSSEEESSDTDLSAIQWPGSQDTESE